MDFQRMYLDIGLSVFSRIWKVIITFYNIDNFTCVALLIKPKRVKEQRVSNNPYTADLCRFKGLCEE